jgi:hypothetical protein
MLFLCCLAAIDCYSQKNALNTFYVNSDIDTMPAYPGGEYAVYQFISTNFRVDQSMKKDVGTSYQVVVLNFIIDTLGKISDIKCSQSNQSDMSNITSVETEIIRIVKEMPDWKPAYKNGEVVNSRIYIPIRFIITDNEFNITTTGTEMVVGNSKKTTALKIVLMTVSTTVFVLLFTKSLNFYGN